MKRISARYNDGFTLVELLITVAIASILLAVGVPSFVNFLSADASKSAAERLMSTLAYARSEAVTRSTNVTVCSLSAGANTCSGASAWANGWLVYIEGAGSDNLDGEAGADDLLLKVQPLNLNVQLNGTPSAASLTYNNLGEATGITVNFMGDDGYVNSGVDVGVNALGSSVLTHRRLQ